MRHAHTIVPCELCIARACIEPNAIVSHPHKQEHGFADAPLSASDSEHDAHGSEDVANADGISAQHLERMRSQQPGLDGARRVHRAERAHYEFHGEPGGSIQLDVKDVLLKLFALKAERNCSAETITDLLLLLKELKCVATDVRENLPTSFKAMLTALHKFGFPDSDLWEYDMCPCSQIFR